MNFQQLNERQLAAVKAPLGPVLVLAGAGSGKTRVLTNRIVYLVKENLVRPENILAITFTNKAANEMKRRLDDFDCGAQFMHISTIHSFCASVLRREADNLSRSRNFTIYADDDRRSILKNIFKEVADESDSSAVDDFSDVISRLKSDAEEFTLDCSGSEEPTSEQAEQAINSYDATRRFYQKLSDKEIVSASQFVKIITEYDRRMAESNAFDFDDLLYYTLKLFVNCPEVLERYRNKYRYICIDEFQDVNKVQYEIFRLLAGSSGNIFVVGDDDQVIYGWRGANVKNILNFENDFEGTKVYKLEQNYRSTKKILDSANKIISLSGNRYEKQLWTENEDGVKVETFVGYNEHDEAYYVSQQIANLRLKGYKLRDCAVLMRVNALSRTFEQEFLRAHLPYKVFGGFKFFERKEIKDLLSYLNLVNNRYDSEAFLRAINVPVRRGIGDTTLKKLRALSEYYAIPLVDVISDERNLEGLNSSIKAKLADFYALYVKLRQAAKTLPISDFVRYVLDTMRFREVYNGAGEEERALNLDEFEQSVAEFQQSVPDATLQDYLETVSLSGDRESDDGSDYVVLSTVHAVKGLEFKAVFVVGLDEGIFPLMRVNSSENDMNEERRLMYVAVTRAEKRLYLTRAKSRFLYGERKDTYASKFFRELECKPSVYVDYSRLDDPGYVDSLNKYQPVSRPKPDSGKSVPAGTYKTGQLVEHDSFGRGMILDYHDNVAVVAFAKAGKKTLDVRFAPMKPVK